jgi:selenium metabolism protein YedF
MEEYLVDARGEVCPRPLILTKRALGTLVPGQPLRILIDNETSKNNVMRFLVDNGYSPQCTPDGDTFTIGLFGAATALTHPDERAYCTSAASDAPHVIVIRSNRMGYGDDALGELLLKAFINTIAEVKPLPGTIVFYNSGVLMTVDDSPVMEALRGLEKAGVTLLVCGTCVNFFNVRERIGAGIISNMYTILETVTAAGKVIEP